ncbi:PLP-dependent aminotransferase family protein [Leucobacter sp. CSA1]|uniref:PLP-dependent aminotransferase family protein n=1 Tax=Leucobacter chromiisoli TaxID=2796471 RepID=A0A934UUZ4_9MICO|nr:PLP-dependent aminotransferase family protein [Leucobacter chromiisoli]MBK0418941.1 PLP-dependent aminotransferase family protein [Leucobacter chromiisoli]
MRHAFPMNLVLDTEQRPGRTARERLTGQLRAALLSGQAGARDPLPSTRSLAAAVGVSRGTVVAAYEDLAGEGYVVTVPGSGTFVADDLPGSPRIGWDTADAPRPAAEPGPPREGAGSRPSPAGEPAGTGGPVINLSPGSPSTRFHAHRDWAAAWRSAVRAELPSLPPPAAGTEELRSLIAEHLRAARGVRCDPDDVVVTAGTSDGLGLLVQGLRPEGPTGARIATEDPGYPAARRVIARLDATPVPIPVSDGGMDAAALAAAPGPFAAVLLTPSHQYPLGGRLPVAARLALLAWARDAGAIVIEDDYDSDFRHGAPSLPTIASLDGEHRVALVGSYSKTLSPWLRCGYLVVPDASLRRRVLDVRADLGQPVSGLVQAALAEFLRSGGLRRHLIRVGREYAHRRALVIDATAHLAPRVGLAAIEGGLHAALTWTRGRSAEQVIARLADRGIRVASLEAYRHPVHAEGAARRPQGIVFGYGAPTDLQLQRALAEIAAALADGGSGAAVRAGTRARRRTGDTLEA